MTIPGLINEQRLQGARSRHQLVIGTVVGVNKANLPYTFHVQVQEAQGVYTLSDCLMVQPIIWPGQGGLILFPTAVSLDLGATAVVMTTGGRPDQSSYIIGFIPTASIPEGASEATIGDEAVGGVVTTYELMGTNWEPKADDMLPTGTIRENAAAPALVGNMPTLAAGDLRMWLAAIPSTQRGINLAERGEATESMPVFVPDPGTADVIPSWTDADGNLKAKIQLSDFSVRTTGGGNNNTNHHHFVEGEITITINRLDEGQPEVRVWYG